MVEQPLSPPAAPRVSALQRFSFIFVGLLLCLVATVVLIISRGFPATSISTDIGADAFPTVYAWLLIVLSLMLIAGHLPKDRTGLNTEFPSGFGYSFAHWSGPLYTVIACVVYIYAMEYIGYLVATMLFMSFIMKIAGIQSWRINLSLAVVLSTTLYFLFSLALNVPLPESSLLESLILE